MESCILCAKVTDTLHRVITDSVTIKALEKSQEFYSSSYNHLLGVIGIFLALITIIFTYYNFKYIKNLKEKLKKEVEEKFETEKKNLNL
jgi:predicted PurR-regulated permease PerM